MAIEQGARAGERHQHWRQRQMEPIGGTQHTKTDQSLVKSRVECRNGNGGGDDGDVGWGMWQDRAHRCTTVRTMTFRTAVLGGWRFRRSIPGSFFDGDILPSGSYCARNNHIYSKSNASQLLLCLVFPLLQRSMNGSRS